MGWNIVRAAVLLTWLTLGLVYLVRAPVMGTRPRRGTALTLSVRGYRILGAGFLALAAMQAAVIVAES